MIISVFSEYIKTVILSFDLYIERKYTRDTLKGSTACLACLVPLLLYIIVSIINLIMTFPSSLALASSPMVD